jgi:hypothetical protein
MTFYTVTYYCNDELVTMYTSAKLAKNGTPVEAAEIVFGQLPPLPNAIVGAFVDVNYLH